MKKSIVMMLAMVTVLGALALLGSSCGGGEQKVSQNAMANEFKDAPKWVTQGCAAYWGEQQGKKRKVICGVGSYAGSRNPEMMRTGAEARARQRIAMTLQVKVKAMVKDYQASITGGEQFNQAASDEQYTVSVTKQVTDVTLTGTETVDTWVSPNGTLYVLMILDLETFKDMLSQVQGLDEGVKQGIIQRSDKAFEEMDEETGKPAENP